MRIAHFIAAGCGTGLAPVAAGTVASAVAVVTGGALLGCSPILLVIACLLASFGGYEAVRRAAVEGDPGWVVIDEFAGQWIALLAIPAPTIPGLLAAFVLFRFFDITKLGPVGWADRRHGAFGIMADDIIAGAVSAVLLALVRLAWPGSLG